MPSPAAFAAIDLGASSARLFDGGLQAGVLALHEVARVPNRPLRLPDGWHTDFLGVHQGMLEGLARLCRQADNGEVWVGIDGWGVDYGFLSGDGRLLGPPFHYRDERTRGWPAAVAGILGEGGLYQSTGVQEMEINTVFQLMADRGSPAYEAAERLLLLPDLMAYLLTGQQRLELTNASTTQLLDCRTGQLAEDLLSSLGLRHDLFAPLVVPGTILGPVLGPVADSVGISAEPLVVSVASHDTASAVLGVPATTEDFAYVVSGTWSLVGLELDHAVVNETSMAANFSNELGVDGTVRFLRNVMGHWMLQECQRYWGRSGKLADLGPLLAAARQCPAFGCVVDTRRPEFAVPGNMPKRVAAVCADTGEPVPQHEAEVARCIVDSMALAMADALEDARRCSGRDVQVVHLVGGGTANDLLLLALSASTGLPVVAGPVEASAIGNLLVQLRAAGQVDDRSAMREIVARSFPLKTVTPDDGLQALALKARERLRSRPLPAPPPPGHPGPQIAPLW